MERAIVGVCYDPRQRRILDITYPSWRRYAARHGLPLVIVNQSYADEDFYWNKHLLFRVPELRHAKVLLFLDNDVFVNPEADSLLSQWDSPLIGATAESTQLDWSEEVINRYYDDYGVDRPRAVQNLQIINTGVLVIPREQGQFLEGVYARWKERKNLSKPAAMAKDPFAREADQPHVSYALQEQNRYRDFGAAYNTLWWHWYRNHISLHKIPFLLRSKAAALTVDRLPRRLWRELFRTERAIFARALGEAEFLHVAGSKSALFLGENYYQ